MLAAFIGGWEILFILLALGVLVAVPLAVVAIVLLLLRRQKKTRGCARCAAPEQRVGHERQEAL